MKRVTVKYSINALSREVPEGTTVGQLVGDTAVKAALGFGDNIKVLLHGVELPNDAVIPPGECLFIETRANQKSLPAVVL